MFVSAPQGIEWIPGTDGTPVVAMAGELVAIAVDESLSFEVFDQLLRRVNRSLVWQFVRKVAHDGKSHCLRIPIATMRPLAVKSTPFINATIFANQKIVPNVRPTAAVHVVVLCSSDVVDAFVEREAFMSCRVVPNHSMWRW